MKRWNGWGDESTEFPIPGIAKDYLVDLLGDVQDLPDVSKTEIIKSVPRSRLMNIEFISTDPMDRLTHSCGQSLPDWINLHSGRIPRITDGVTYPNSDEDIETAIDFAKSNQMILIPYGGGTSVVGHINPPQTDTPILTLDLSRLNRLLEIDESSQLATFEAGVRGLEIESVLNKDGYTLGHFPQSFEFSTLGGWIATRSCGQQSYHYGRIEDIFRGGHFISPVGTLELPPFPASAAGPDIRQIILGSEGRLGIISRAIVQIKRLPQFEGFYGIFFKNWDSGLMAVQEIAQRRILLSMLRLSDAQETETTLILSGKENLLRLARLGLEKLGYGNQRCLLIIGVTGDKKNTDLAQKSAIRICRKYGGLYTGNYIGKSWKKNRFLAPYLRNSLWKAGYALDTLETAVHWEKVDMVKQAIIGAITQTGINLEIPILVFGHLSHVYPTGASIYITYMFRRAANPEENLERWQMIKNAASQAIINQGGTISHQHGIGRDHAKYLSPEKGTLGINLLQDISSFFDPHEVLNPQVMIDQINSDRY